MMSCMADDCHIILVCDGPCIAHSFYDGPCALGTILQTVQCETPFGFPAQLEMFDW
jgi:hypothetical protein